VTTNQTEPEQDFVFTEYQEFLGTNPEGMERYLLKAIALPERTERFNWEEYEEDGPLLVKIRNWGPIWRSHLIRKCESGVWLGIFMGLIFSYFGMEGALLSVVFAVVLLVAAIGGGGAIGLSIYKRNVKLVEDDTLRDVVFRKQLPQWAVARYDFKSEEDFLATLRGKDGQRCYLAEGGSLSGLVVSANTGEEWPLKPV
jgi:hypothetical protein